MFNTADSTTHTTMGKSKELSIDLKENITDVNKSGKTLKANSKQLQVSRPTAQTTVSIKFMAQLCHCHHQEENIIYQLKSKSVMNQKLLEKCVLNQHWLRGCCVREKPLI